MHDNDCLFMEVKKKSNEGMGPVLTDFSKTDKETVFCDVG